MRHLLILGLGYAGRAIAREARQRGWRVTGARRAGDAAARALDDPALPGLVQRADAVVATAPPGPDGDPLLARFGRVLAARRGRALVYLSSTGVYGDTRGAWVDESHDTGEGQRTARIEADRAWLALGACAARLGGIYGPGRSAFDRLRDGTARRIDRPGHRFSRIHADDIAGGVMALVEAGARGPANLVDELPAEPAVVMAEAALLLGVEPPPLVPLEAAGLSPMAQSFWAERRLVAGRRLSRWTGYRLRYPDYRQGLRAIAKAEGMS